ncbi:MAG: holliday junction helicase RuvA [Blastocatellia bacterium]|jgi:Holliday junction DNA helicase RuvA|nr:holliday junction helicase RuvA [Blastocatellia bacterium]
MIAHLSGTLLAKQATSVILDVGGVGYEVTIPLSTFYDLEEIGSTAKLRIYTYVREDSLQLFGFRTLRERELFLKLISVGGIGPKLGITILSGMSADEIILSIRTNNLGRLTSIPGIGKKTAERIVIELRDKIAALSGPQPDEDPGSRASRAAASSADTINDDALSALLNFGYQKNAAEKALSSAMQEGGEITVETLLRRSLRLLAK